MAAILAASAALYAVLRLAGAASLVVLGLLALRAALTGRHADDPGAALAGAPVSMTRVAGFRSGLLTNLLNPKIGVSRDAAGRDPRDAGQRLVVRGRLVRARAGDIVRRGWVRRVLEGLTGAVLVALGVRVALDAHEVLRSPEGESCRSTSGQSSWP